MGAMPEEITGVTELMSELNEVHIGKRVYYTGSLNGVNVVVVFSRWGKVAAATTVTTLILQFGITQLVFTGVAGAINNSLNIGDIVVAKRLVQHDMDARPLLPLFEIPLLQKTYFETSKPLRNQAKAAVEEMIDREHLQQITPPSILKRFGILKPIVYVGDVASGDHFFSSLEAKTKLAKLLPETLCVEMEGAAVAQVCYEYDIPFVVIRTISDTADDRSHTDFAQFVRHVASNYSVGLIRNLFT